MITLWQSANDTTDVVCMHDDTELTVRTGLTVVQSAVEMKREMNVH